MLQKLAAMKERAAALALAPFAYAMAATYATAQDNANVRGALETNEEALEARYQDLIEQRKAKGAAIDPNEPLVRQAGLSESSLQRYKGLGEMDADQLWETTMNPENRVLIQVRLEDAERADAIFSKLMGDEVSVRKNFIQTHAKDVSLEELDV